MLFRFFTGEVNVLDTNGVETKFIIIQKINVLVQCDFYREFYQGKRDHLIK